ncbi:MAG: nucleotidyltransferase family protein [Candidatus Asgardarchaeia archaeon]
MRGLESLIFQYWKMALESGKMTMTKEEILRKLGENKEKIKKFGVKRIGIFGSYVRGEAKEKSDIDFIVEFEEGRKTFDNFMELAFFLEELCGKKVDLLTPEGISPYIRPYVEREVIYARL